MLQPFQVEIRIRLDYGHHFYRAESTYQDQWHEQHADHCAAGTATQVPLVHREQVPELTADTRSILVGEELFLLLSPVRFVRSAFNAPH